MSLKHRVLAFVTLAILALNAGLYFATNRIVMQGFAQREREEMDQRARSAREIVHTMLDEFLVRTTDWAEWDDTALLLEDQNESYVDDNIQADALASLQWDAFVVLRHGDGAQLVAAGLDPARENLVDLEPALLAHLTAPQTHGAAGEPRVGLVDVDGELWMTSSREVLHTDKHAPSAPGRLVIGSRVTPQWVERLRQFTFLDVSLRGAEQDPADAVEAAARAQVAAQPDAVSTHEVSEEQISSFGYLRDIYGSDVALMRIDSARPLLAQGRAILRSAMLTIVVAGGLLLALTLLGTARILGRLDSLLRGVESLQRGEARAVPVAVDDEIGKLTHSFNSMAQTIVERERSLSAINARMRLVLDSIGDGLVPCDLDGTVLPGASQRAEQWFGRGEGRKAWEHLFEPNDAKRAEFELAWQQLREGFLPLELALDQMPRTLARGAQRFEVEFKLVEKDGAVQGLLLVVKDVSARVERERAEQEARELQTVMANVLRDSADFERFLEEMDGLLEGAVSSEDTRERARLLHTLKGNSAVYGFASYADVCHQVEDALAEGEEFAGFVRRLRGEWSTAVARVRSLLPDGGESRVVLSMAEYESFLEQVRSSDDIELVQLAEAWRFRPVSAAFARLSSQAARTAQTLGKSVEVVCSDPSIRFEPALLDPFWKALVHVVRNAIDHGLESADERLARGKPATGRLQLEARIEGEEFSVRVSDDGRGIVWSDVREAAQRLGLACATHRELVDALFHDGFSTRADVGTVSGRGVGLAAVKQAVEALDGRIEVHSESERGASFTFHFPARRRAPVLAISTS